MNAGLYLFHHVLQAGWTGFFHLHLNGTCQHHGNICHCEQTVRHITTDTVTAQHSSTLSQYSTHPHCHSTALTHTVTAQHSPTLSQRSTHPHCHSTALTHTVTVQHSPTLSQHSTHPHCHSTALTHTVTHVPPSLSAHHTTLHAHNAYEAIPSVRTRVLKVVLPILPIPRLF